MKKLFTFFAAALFACVAFAEDQYPDPSTSNSLASAIINVGDGETIWLDDAAPYVNHYASEGGDDYTKLRSAKNITIKAIEGKNPIIKLEVPFQVREAVNAKFIGVKFDGSSITHYDHYFNFYDGADNVVEFENCELSNLASDVYLIRIDASKKASKISFDKCNVHDIATRILNQGTVDNFVIKDSKFSSFANYPVYDNYSNGITGKITIEGSEFDNLSYGVIHNTSAAHVGTCIIDDCYFHDGKRTAIFFEAPASAQAQVDDISVTNSTFANYAAEAYYASIIDIRNGGSQTALGKVLIDHCTFFNCLTINTDHVAVRVHKSTDATVSNCIFSDPSQSAEVDASKRAATNLYGGNIKNCIAYNYLYTADGHIHNGATYTSCSQADPLFVDAANSNFILGEGSPALTAGTDGDAIGDPRWAPEDEPIIGEPKTIYCKVQQSWWTDGSAAVGIYAWGEGVAANAEWPGVRMSKVEGQAGLWSFELPAQYTSVVFTRMNPSNDGDQYWGAKTGDQVVPTDEKDIFTITTSTKTWDPATVEGAWSVYIPETPAKFYITGNEALVGEKKWTSDAVKVTEDSYTFENLAVGDYVIKITTDGTWDTAKGYDDLTSKPAGLTADKDGNICFKMKEVGDITVTYTGEVFTVGGDFYVPVLPNDFYLVGKINGVEKWDPALITEANRFVWNSGEGDKAEFKVVANLTKGDKLKAVYIYEDEITEWYPAGEGGEYLITEWTAGEKTVYFRKDYSGTDWGHNLYIEANEPTVTYSDFEIDLRDGQLGTEGSNLQKYLTVGEPYVYSDEMPIAYNAILNAARFNNAQDPSHGYVNFVATIPVEAGNYKITVGNCSYNSTNGSVKNADGTETLDLIDKNGQTITAIETPKNCYHQSTTENITSVWFVAEAPQTIQIVCPQYAPYIKVEQVAEVPEEVIVYSVTFAHAEGATGVLPANLVDLAPTTKITLPNNFSMYKEGYTFDGWTDGEDVYDPGFKYEVTDDVKFTAVYAENTVSLAGRTEAVTIKWEFSQSKGVAPIDVSGTTTFVVAQATIGESKIDVKLPIDATAGKFVNSANSWTQINPGVIFSIPSAKDAVITYKQYDAGAVTTPEINVSESDATYQLVAAGTSGQLYYEYVQVALPKPTATSISNTEVSSKAQKLIENGQIVIIKNGVKYNVLGACLK